MASLSAPSLLLACAAQVFNYMRPEPGALKDEYVDVDPDRHLYFRSAFVMNHAMGEWRSASDALDSSHPPSPLLSLLTPRWPFLFAGGGPQRQLRRLVPSLAVRDGIVADRSMVGVHIRNVFDAPRDAESSVRLEGQAAMEGAKREYGAEGTAKLLQWRRASHWTNFVGYMGGMLHGRDTLRDNLSHNSSLRRGSGGASVPSIRFYLAADSEDAYTGLAHR